MATLGGGTKAAWALAASLALQLSVAWGKTPCKQAPRASWTILYYSNGDNNLEHALLTDLEEALLVGSTPDQDLKNTGQGIHIAALLDTKNLYSGSHFIHVRKTTLLGDATSYKSQIERIDDVLSEDIAQAGDVWPRGEANMSDPETLREFIVEAARCYPAEHYALVINGHGFGARGRADSEVPSDARGFGADETVPDWQLGTSQPNRHLLVGDATRAIAEALQDNEAFPTGEKSLDLIGLDACLMGTVEVAYAFALVSEVLVASEALEGPQGWRHDLWLGALKQRPTMSAAELAQELVQSYQPAIETQYNRSAYLHNWLPKRTISAVQMRSSDERSCDSMYALSQRFAQFVTHVGEQDLGVLLREARGECPDFAPREGLALATDSGCMLRSLRRLLQARRWAYSQPELVLELDGLARSLDCLVIEKDIGSSWKSRGGNVNGLSIFFPKERDKYLRSAMRNAGSAERAPVQFFKATAWDRLLESVFESEL